jgi:hypothetical protein
MSGDVVNLRQFRKRKARMQAEREAADNRVKFGRKKSEKQLTESERARNAARLEGHRLDPDDKSREGNPCDD